MPDSYVDVTRVGYFSRIGSAVRSMVVGGLMFLASFVLLFQNEGCAVRRARALDEGGSKVVTIDSASVAPANENKLVHFTGAAVGGVVRDPVFGVSGDGVRLMRLVQMYQWAEEKRTQTRMDGVGGGETKRTTYTYTKQWAERLTSASSFEGLGRQDGQHDNPPTMPFASDQWTAAPVVVGAFTLPAGLVAKMDAARPLPVDESMRAGLPADRQSSAVVRDDSFYLPYRADRTVDPSSPQIGDMRVSYKLVPDGPVTVMAKQSGSTLAPYDAKSGQLFELHAGTETAAQLIKGEQAKNTVQTWILRLVGFVVMWIGLVIVLAPFKVMADVVGLIGDVVGIGIGIVSFMLAFALSLVTIGVAWLFYRPLLAVGLFALAALGVAGIVALRKRGRAGQAARYGGAPGAGPVAPVPPLPR